MSTSKETPNWGEKKSPHTPLVFHTHGWGTVDANRVAAQGSTLSTLSTPSTDGVKSRAEQPRPSTSIAGPERGRAKAGTRLPRSPVPNRAIPSMEPTLGASVVTDATAPHLLGMTPRAFREAVQRQGIPFVRLGARILVVVADLERLAHRNDKPAASPDDETPAATADTLLERHGFRRTT